MRTRFKALTVGLVLATAAIAGCSSTTAGSVQDDATMAASSSSSAATSSGAAVASAGPVDSADVVASGAPASPDVLASESPSASVSPAGQALLGASGPVSNDLCDPGLQYACGDIGQSGVGIVFYASSTSFACGANMASTCNYLESAPNLWNPDSEVSCKQAASFTSCGGSTQTTSDFSSGSGFPWCTGTVIGSGYANTTAMLPVCYWGEAGNMARSYVGGGMTDWSLASQDELNALYSYPNRDAIGGFNSGIYWSSSQDGPDAAWAQYFGTSQGSAYKSNPGGVRPIRAF
ncbi:MAG: DUF1566 domain-containing protein [Actinobacteria bacterium]|nr:DUF1566 domain-containing protein [Actinomycetota bacterium]